VHGSVVLTEPTKTTSLQLEATYSSINNIALRWLPLTTFNETGGSPVLNYMILWN